GLKTILRCRIKFTIRPGEVTEGFTEATEEVTEATMVVAVAMIAMTVPALMTFFPRHAEAIGVTAATIVLVIERITHGASDETSDGTSEGSSDDTSDETSDSSFGHSTFSIVARD